MANMFLRATKHSARVSGLLSLLTLLLLCGCAASSDSAGGDDASAGGGATSANGGGSNAPYPIPRDVESDVELTWNSFFGPGGTVVPAMPKPPGTTEEGDGFTQLVGIVLPPGDEEILFLGTSEPGLPQVHSNELIDAFCIAMRAGASQQAPGVTFEPTAAQLDRGLRDGDLLEVTYFGAAEETGVGYNMYEADRTMKSLSSGKDTITREPMNCTVPGYRSELELLADAPANEGKQAWHRFWIEPLPGSVSMSSDGRCITADLELAVKTRYMVSQGGQLYDADRLADPVARRFATHLTDNYDLYAKDFDSLAHVKAYAGLTSIAEALITPTDERVAEGATGEPGFSNLLLRHRVQPVHTPFRTPSTVEKLTRSTSTYERTLQVSGGVDLRPRTNDVQTDPRLDELQSLVLNARQSPGQAQWSVPFQGRDINVLAKRISPQVHTWQRDLEIGELALIRDHLPESDSQDFGRGWSLRRPTVREVPSSDGKRKTLVFQERPDEQHTMVPGQITVPGTDGPVPAYIGRNRRLAQFANVWLYLEGQVEFISRNGGPYTPEPRAGGRVIQFSAEDGHAVELVRTASGSIEYSNIDSRLSSITDGTNEIRFGRNGSGLINEVTATNNRKIRYLYDSGQRLRAAVDEQGPAIDYSYLGRSETRLAGARVPGLERNVDQDSNVAQFDLAEPLSPSEARELDRAASGARLAVIRIDFDKDVGEYAISIAGEPFYKGTNLEQLLFQFEGGQPAGLQALVDQILTHPQVQTPKRLLITGDHENRNFFAQAVRRLTKDQGLSVDTATDPALAVRNESQAPVARQQADFSVFEKKLDPVIYDALSPMAQSKSSDLVLIAGDNHADFIKHIYARGNAGEFQGKHVILATCCNRELPQAIDQILNKFGAVSVFSFKEPIKQRLLQPFTEGLQKRLSGEGPDIDYGELKRLIQETVEEIGDETLDDWNLQIGHYDSSAGSTGRHELLRFTRVGPIV